MTTSTIMTQVAPHIAHHYQKQQNVRVPPHGPDDDCSKFYLPTNKQINLHKNTTKIATKTLKLTN